MTCLSKTQVDALKQRISRAETKLIDFVTDERITCESCIHYDEHQTYFDEDECGICADFEMADWKKTKKR